VFEAARTVRCFLTQTAQEASSALQLPCVHLNIFPFLFEHCIITLHACEALSYRAFELGGCVQESQVQGMATVTPEHICLAICNSRNTGAIRVLRACVPTLISAMVIVALSAHCSTPLLNPTDFHGCIQAWCGNRDHETRSEAQNSSVTRGGRKEVRYEGPTALSRAGKRAAL
jgi:hypothetical protein